MARGDVLRVELPSPDGSREQAGRRPAIAVQADVKGVSTPTAMVVPLTSNLEALRFPYTIRVEPSATNGLTQQSVLLVFQLRAIDRNRITGTIGTLEKECLVQLDVEMRRLLAL